ncbi:MAG TPA: MFS transporter [Ktedonobacteraceae bacterium]|nr:MFS transporter [Ktedonobacteraceae bacterium]
MKKPPSVSVAEQERQGETVSARWTRGPLRAFTSLRQRNYRSYWLGQMVSLIGTSMQTLGQSWLVLKLTQSPLQLGLVGALQFLPVLLFSIFGGVFADRWPKKRVLLLTQTADMLLAFLLWVLVATDAVQLWHVYILVLLLGIASTLDKPARQSFVIELVGRTELPNAVALNFSIVNLARVVGPGLGGVIIALSGVKTLFLLNALSYGAALLGLALINSHQLYARPEQENRASERQKTWQSLRAGVAYVWHTPAVLLTILVVGFVLLFGSNFGVVLPLFATDVLNVGATGFGFLSAATGIGALIATLWLAWSHQRPTLRAILLGALIFSVVEAAFALSRSYVLSLALIAGIGFTEIFFATLAITALQTIAPDSLRGRVMSVYILFFDGSVPLGYLLTGWLAALFGAPLSLLIGAILALLTTGAGWLRRKPAEVGFTEATRPEAR